MVDNFVMIKYPDDPEPIRRLSVYSVFWSGSDNEQVKKVAILMARMWKRITTDAEKREGNPAISSRLLTLREGRTTLKIFTIKTNEDWDLLACVGKIDDTIEEAPDMVQIWNQGDGREHIDLDDPEVDVMLHEVEDFTVWS